MAVDPWNVAKKRCRDFSKGRCPKNMTKEASKILVSDPDGSAAKKQGFLQVLITILVANYFLATTIRKYVLVI